MMWLLIFLCVLIVLHIGLWCAFPPVPKRKKQEIFDICIVLGCPTNLDGTITEEQLNRTKLAIDLYHKGIIKTILFTGGSAHNTYIEAETMATYARMKQVPNKDILIEKKALNTYENLMYSKAICRSLQIQKVLIITSHPHMRRANYFVRKHFDTYAMEGCISTTPQRLSEYFRMWNTLYYEYRLRKRK